MTFDYTYVYTVFLREYEDIILKLKCNLKRSVLITTIFVFFFFNDRKY